MHVSRFVMLAAVATMLASPVVHAQSPQMRDGFWFNVGLGWGSFSCEDCADRDGGFSGALGLGGSLSQRVLLGASYNFWTKTEDDVTFTVGTFTAAMRFYPSSRGGFFLLGGLGIG